MRLLLGGAETQFYRRLMLAHGVQDCALSWYWLRDRIQRRREKLDEVMDDLRQFRTVYLDSGWRTLHRQFRGPSPKYVSEYLELLEEWGPAFTFCGGLRFLNEPITMEWLEAVAGVPNMAPSLTSTDQAAHLDFVAEHFNYASVFANDPGRPPHPTLAGVIATLGRAGVRVHGHGITDRRSLRIYPLTTVSSNTWLSGVRFGTLYIFTGTRVQAYQKGKMMGASLRMRSISDRYGIDFLRLRAGKSPELAIANLLAWKSFAEYLGGDE